FKVRVTDNGTPVLFDEEQITVTVTATFSLNATTNESVTAQAVKATLYPNPVADKLTVTMNGTADGASVTVTDERGLTIIKSARILNGRSSLEIDVAKLKPGIYFLNLQTTNGYQTLKFIKL
ncbi:MAG: T9SS type A sorting domain-containing protein, partial [Panacibacter sp.]